MFFKLQYRFTIKKKGGILLNFAVLSQAGNSFALDLGKVKVAGERVFPEGLDTNTDQLISWYYVRQLQTSKM